MTLAQFKEHRQSIKKSLEYNLIKDKVYLNAGLQTYRKDSVKEVSQTIEIRKEDDAVYKIKELETLVNTVRQIRGTTVTQQAITKREYCSTEFVGTAFTVTWKELRTEIDDKQVERHMGRYVGKMLTVKEKRNTGYDWDLVQLDCKIMSLFKSEKITWEDCVEAHSVNCGL